MNRDRWDRINRLFFECVPLASDQRASVLESACREDGALRAEVEALLDADNGEARQGFLEPRSPVSLARLLFADDVHGRNGPGSGRQIGRFRLHELIGRGGTSEVYRVVLADEDSTAGGRSSPPGFALKLISSHMVTQDVLYRFKSEQKLLASIRHPNVAQYFDSGITDDGLPYLVMELIEGQRIDHYCEENELSIRERVELVIQVCDAVEFIHQNGVFHRDLTPPNILVTSEHIPKLVDFGIAKSSGEATEPFDSTQQTATGAILGVPAYLSPEQAAGRSRNTDLRTDIYTVGVLLFRLMTGRHPFEAVTLAGLLDEIRHSEPAPPSRINSEISRPLDIICLTCLQKDPGQRYASAELLSEDLRRSLDGRRIKARPISRVEYAWRWCKRNQVVAGLLVTLVTTLAVSVVVVSGLWMRADAERRSAEADYRIARAALAGTLELAGKAISPAGPSTEQLHSGLLTARKLLLDVSAHRAHDPELLAATAYINLLLSRHLDIQGKTVDAHRFADESLVDWQKILELRPDDAKALYRRWDSFVARIRNSGEQSELDEKVRRIEQAVEMGRELLKSMPNYDYALMTECRLSLAKLLVRRGENNRAASVLWQNFGDLEAHDGAPESFELLRMLLQTHAELVEVGEICSELQANEVFDVVSSGSISRLFSSEFDGASETTWAKQLFLIVQSSFERQSGDSTLATSTGAALIDLVATMSSTKRGSGRLDGAQRLANRMRAFGLLLTTRFPDVATAHLVLACAHEQSAKNAWKTHDRGVINRNLRLAFGEAMEAMRVEPHNSMASREASLLWAKIKDLTTLTDVVVDRGPPKPE